MTEVRVLFYDSSHLAAKFAAYGSVKVAHVSYRSNALSNRYHCIYCHHFHFALL